MIYIIKFNVFSNDKQYNKTITVKAINYDDARRKVIREYPGARYIVIYMPEKWELCTDNDDCH